MNKTDKAHVIRKFVILNGGRVLKIDPDIILCVYDLYEIISKSTPENVIRNINQYSGLVLNEQYMSTVYMYIGFFCAKCLRTPDLEFKIANYYNKLAIELGNVTSMYNTACNYHRANNYNKALKYYNLTLKNKDSLDYTIYYLYSDIGNVNYSMNNFEVAIRFYKLQLESDDSNHQSFIEKLALSYYNCKSYRKAIKYFYKLVRLRVCVYKIHKAIAKCYYRDVKNNVDIEYELSTLISDEIYIKKVYKAIALIYKKEGNYKLSLKYYKMGYVNKKDKLVREKCIIFSKMNDNVKSLKYFKLLVEALVSIKSDQSDRSSSFYKNEISIKSDGSELLNEDYGLVFCSNKNYDSLVYFYLFNKNDIKILEMLSNGCDLQTSTIETIINYFNDGSSALCGFITFIIKPKILLLDSHFAFAINSDGYFVAKTNFYKEVSSYE